MIRMVKTNPPQIISTQQKKLSSLQNFVLIPTGGIFTICCFLILKKVWMVKITPPQILTTTWKFPSQQNFQSPQWADIPNPLMLF